MPHHSGLLRDLPAVPVTAQHPVLVEGVDISVAARGQPRAGRARNGTVGETAGVAETSGARKTRGTRKTIEARKTLEARRISGVHAGHSGTFPTHGSHVVRLCYNQPEAWTGVEEGGP